MTVMLVVTILTVGLVRYALKKRKVTTIQIFAAAIVGLTLGLFLDVVAGYGMGLWTYARHPYWTTSYWMVLPGMWTEFGIGVYITWRIIRPRWAVIPLTCLPYELYGILRHSWQYSVPWWVVAIGWIPLILVMVFLTERLAGMKKENIHVGRKASQEFLAK